MFELQLVRLGVTCDCDEPHADMDLEREAVRPGPGHDPGCGQDQVQEGHDAIVLQVEYTHYNKHLI